MMDSEFQMPVEVLVDELVGTLETDRKLDLVLLIHSALSILQQQQQDKIDETYIFGYGASCLCNVPECEDQLAAEAQEQYWDEKKFIAYEVPKMDDLLQTLEKDKLSRCRQWLIVLPVKGHFVLLRILRQQDRNYELRMFDSLDSRVDYKGLCREIYAQRIGEDLLAKLHDKKAVVNIKHTFCPKQKANDGVSCGLFVLQRIAELVKDPDMVLLTKDIKVAKKTMDKFRTLMVSDLWHKLDPEGMQLHEEGRKLLGKRQ